jgi:hypothetical protein
MTKPTIRERLRERICPNCGNPVARRSAKGPAPTFCGRDTCKREMNNRLMGEGLTVIGLLKAWRVDRGSGEIAQGCFAQAIEALDNFNQQDREAGRPRADYYGATLLAKGTRYVDRQRRRKGPSVEQRVADEAGPELADEAVEAVRAAMDADPNMAF